jgi:hypothetical protein
MAAEPSSSREFDDLFERYLATREGTGAFCVCTTAGCWQPERETWQEFCVRKGLDPNSRLVI